VSYVALQHILLTSIFASVVTKQAFTADETVLNSPQTSDQVDVDFANTKATPRKSMNASYARLEDLTALGTVLSTPK
jgi:hypothetical protein